METNTAKLKEALERVKPGLANKEVVEQATSFAFLNGKVITYNDEISISHPIEGLDDLQGAVEAESLYKLLSKVKQETIELSLNNDTEIMIKAGRTRVGLTLQAEVKLPLEETTAEKGKWKPLPILFIRYLSLAMTSCSSDMSRPVLTAVHINKNGFIEASDGNKITRCDLKEELPIKTVLIPATSAVHIVKLNPIKIAEGKGWLHFLTENKTIISCRIFEDAFPNTLPHLNVTGKRLVLPEKIEEVIDRAMIFAKRDHILEEALTITFSPKKCEVSTKSETNWFKEAINSTYEGDILSFIITPYLLKGILSETLAFTYSKQKLKFEGDGWIYIAALRHTK